MLLWILLALAGVLAVTSAAIFRRRRRSLATVITDFVAAELVWIDAPPTLNAIGATAPSRAVARNAEHQVLPSQPTITYSSGTPANATVNSATGIVTAVANGPSVITAASAGLTSITQTATVSQVVASISGVASTLSTDDSSSGTFSPVGKDANNNTVSGATFAYASSNPSIISVNASTGAWVGQSAGSTTITITSGSATFVVSVTVIVSTFSISASTSPIYIGTAFTLTALYNGSSVTADDYSSSDITKVTVDPPTLTSISPSTITQGTNATYTFTGTNCRSGQTIGGLPTGVTASSYSYTSTTVTCTLTATGSATTGAASLYLADSTHGNSGTQTLTVNSAGGMGTLPVTSGLVLRLHAEAGITTGTGVASWTDQSSTGAVFSQATGANQPTYIAAAYNGKHCLRFNGSQWLQAAAVLAALNPASPFTLYVVAKMTGTSSTDRALFSSRDTGAFAGYAMLGIDHNGVITYTGADGTALRPVGLATPDTTTLHSLTAVVNTASGTKETVYQDATQKNTAADGFTPNTTKAACVGSESTNPSGTNLGTKADITEILLYTGAHNSTQVTAMHGYFQTEWGTP